MTWMDLASHEVGHIKDIHEIGGGKIKYFWTFAHEYISAGSHDGNWREQRADIGQNQFKSFVKFVDSYYGKDKLKALFENKSNTEENIKTQVNKWWRKFQKLESIKSKKSSKS